MAPGTYKVQKTLEAKAKIKEYFVLDLMSIEGFAKLAGVGGKKVEYGPSQSLPPPKDANKVRLAAGALTCYTDSTNGRLIHTNHICKIYTSPPLS